MNRKPNHKRSTNPILGWRPRSLRVKMMFSFLGLFFIITLLSKWVEFLGVPFTNIEGEYRQQQNEIFKNLNLIADLKKEQLVKWLEERIDDTKVISKSDLVSITVHKFQHIYSDLLKQALSREEFRTLIQKEESFRKLNQHLTIVKKLYGVYEAIQIVNVSSGRIIFSTRLEDLGVDVSGFNRFDNALLSSDVVLNIEECPIHGELDLFISSPHLDIPGPTPGESFILIMQIDYDDILRSMLNIGGGLGATGEALLVNQEVKILTGLKHPLADGTLAVPLEYRIQAKPAVLAARGEEGIILTNDYRGEMVLAAYRHIRITPETGWGLVVKWDQDEVFTPLRESIFYTSLVALVGFIVMVGIVFLLAKNLSRPLRLLSRTALDVEAGNLDVQAPVLTSDEVGSLAITFNSMIIRLRNWYHELEELVKQRTEELKKANKMLATEITVRKQAETAAETSRRQFELVLTTAGEGIFGIDLDGNTTFVNPAAEKMIGWEPDRLIGHGQHHDVVHHSKPDGSPYPREDCPIHATIKDGKTHRVDDEVFWRKDGSFFSVEYISTPIIDEIGKIEGAVVTFMDITKRKITEQKIERLIIEIIAKNKEMEQLVYITSHDLRSPLVNIQGYSKELEYDLAGIRSALKDMQINTEQEKQLLTAIEKDIPESLNYIRTSATKMDRLLSGLLRLSRLGRLALEIKLLDMNKLITEVINSFEFQINEANVTLDIGKLPPCKGDDVQINRVFSNLVDNALKYQIPENQGVIRISGKKKGTDSIYCIEDNGIGIAVKHKERIFELFHQLDPENSAGEGLGLTIVQRILGRHKGKIWFESELGKGTKFFVSIPNS